MNKGIIFTLGALFGAGVGSTVTYFIVRDIEAARADEAIDRYATYSDERVQRAIDKLKDNDVGELDEPDESQPMNDDEKITKNEGVKKYHHQNGLESAYGSNHIFAKKQSDKEKKEIKEEIENVAESKLIDEITEEEFSVENGYNKEVIDVCLGDDKDMVGIWGYQTDNEEFVEKRFGKSIEALLGNRPYEELLEYTANNDAIGSLYLRNESMMTDFEFVLRDYREEDK